MDNVVFLWPCDEILRQLMDHFLYGILLAHIVA